MAMTKPASRPVNPRFSSGPCAKPPVFDLAKLSDAPLGRSHRAAVGKAKLKAAIDGTREILGIPDEYRGETPKAFVKLKSGASVSEDELLDFAEKNLNPIERPAEIEIRDELPKTMIGKLSKKELVSEHRQQQEVRTS